MRQTNVNNAAGRLTDIAQRTTTAGDTSLSRKLGRILVGKHIAANLIMVRAK